MKKWEFGMLLALAFIFVGALVVLLGDLLFYSGLWESNKVIGILYLGYAFGKFDTYLKSLRNKQFPKE